MRKLGIIGGLGPLASAYFYERVTLNTAAVLDQEHIEIYLHSVPQTPDRTAYILNRTMPSPLPKLAASGNALVRLGCSVIAMPCVTAHVFIEQIRNEISDRTPDGTAVIILDAVRETVLDLCRRAVCRVGIMATSGTLASGIFDRALSEYGIESILPSPRGQERIMSLIYDYIKRGLPINAPLFYTVADELFAFGADVCVIGCTELSLASRVESDSETFVDTLDVLSRRAVALCKTPGIDVTAGTSAAFGGIYAAAK